MLMTPSEYCHILFLNSLQPTMPQLPWTRVSLFSVYLSFEIVSLSGFFFFCCWRFFCFCLQVWQRDRAPPHCRNLQAPFNNTSKIHDDNLTTVEPFSRLHYSFKLALHNECGTAATTQKTVYVFTLRPPVRCCPRGFDSHASLMVGISLGRNSEGWQKKNKRRSVNGFSCRYKIYV